ncbi:MAG: 4Fe-4S binding protein [Veillonellaceae bacterium]|jgi:ferredoxin|nr:4Fe-4S binding protein [Veillonellaceae bacterium]
MLRKIIEIDEEKCNGCGLCIGGCHEGALHLVNGKARLVADSYCDGLGACLPDCPTGALAIIEREAPDFDEEAVKQHLAAKAAAKTEQIPCGCPGANVKLIQRTTNNSHQNAESYGSELRQWPCQLRLVPVSAPYFDNAHLLVAADCTAYAYANMHADFMRDRITVIGCPKFDKENYSFKLAQILSSHEIKSVTVVRMEVPCCSGIAHAVNEAVAASGKAIPAQTVIIGTDGTIKNL